MDRNVEDKRRGTESKRRGRPVERAYPDRIDATPEEIAEKVLAMPPKKAWRYLEDKRA